MKITIETIPHEKQEYTTCGNWKIAPNGDIAIFVSSLSDWRREMLVAVHELVEVLSCKQDGVGQAAVDAFDHAFEAKRLEGNNDEPGDDPQAPYLKQHCFATGIERLLAAQWGVVWKDYEQELCDLPEIPNRGYIHPA